jgi:hypothetical protein
VPADDEYPHQPEHAAESGADEWADPGDRRARRGAWASPSMRVTPPIHERRDPVHLQSEPPGDHGVAQLVQEHPDQQQSPR